MPDKSLTVYVFDVGHGDSIVIKFPDGISHAIVDCNRYIPEGKSTPRIKAVEYFEQFLKEEKKPIIEFICLSHPHADHFSGMAALITFFLQHDITVREYWDFGASIRKAQSMVMLARDESQQKNLAEFSRLIKAKIRLQERKVQYRILAGPQKDLYDKHDVKIHAIAPAFEHFEDYTNFLALETNQERAEFLKSFPCSGNDNIVCSALHVQFGSCNVILGGDLTNRAWYKILDLESEDSPSRLSCDALKISHHGSYDGNFPHQGKSLCEFIKGSGQPLIAMISGGYRSNLPHPETLQSFGKKCSVFCTGKATSTLVPYKPTHLVNDEEALALFEMDEIFEVQESIERGHGDLVFSCQANGSRTVTTEFECELPHLM